MEKTPNTQNQKPRRPRAVILSSTSSKSSSKIEVNPEIIGCVKRKIQSTKKEYGNQVKKQKTDPLPENLDQSPEVPHIVFSKTKLSPIKTYGRRKQSQLSSSEVSKILGNERDSLIGTSLLEVSTGEDNLPSKNPEVPEKLNESSKKNILEKSSTPEDIGSITLGSLSEQISEKISDNSQHQIQNISHLESGISKTYESEKKSLQKEPQNTPNIQESLNLPDQLSSSHKTLGMIPESVASPSASSPSYMPNQGSLFSLSKLTTTEGDLNLDENLAKKEKIVEIQSQKGKPMKVIVKEEKKKNYGINWNNYIDGNISEKLAEDFFYRRRRTLNLNAQEDQEEEIINSTTNVQSIEEKKDATEDTMQKRKEIEDQHEQKRKVPKLPFTKKKRFGKREQLQSQKEEAIQKTNEEDQKNIVETFKNDVINQIQIKIESDVTTPPGKKINRNKVLLKFFQEQRLTVRMMKRVNFILKTLKEDKVICDTFKFYKTIRDHEIEVEGLKTTVDRKSIKRLLTKLSEYGLIKYRNATLKSNQNIEQNIEFICDSNLTDDDTIISMILEEFKVKFFLIPRDNDAEPESEPKAVTEVHNEAEAPVVPHTQEESLFTERSEPKDQNFKFNRAISKKYGYCPKFAKYRKMHELLYYIVYENDISEPITDPHVIENILGAYGGSSAVFDDCNQCPIYASEVSWKMFIPPLKSYQGYPKGWVMIGDILLRLPLSIFTSCASVSYEIPGLLELLEHPVKKNILIQNVPDSIIKSLIFVRKLTSWLVEFLRSMCYFGWVQFGPPKFKDRNQMFIYLNRKASLLNTVKSSMGYHQISEGDYKKMDYTFETGLDLEQFWYDMWCICANTPLGHRNAVAGEYIILENPITKPELIESLNPRQPEEAPKLDTGYIPGDKKGAAGFDSCLFSHLKRNWSWLNSINTTLDDLSFPKRVIKKPELNPEKTVKKFVVTQQEKVLKPQPMKVSSQKREKTPPKKENAKKKLEVPRFKVKPKQKIREVAPQRPKKKKMRQEYDEVDKVCLSRMRKLRTEWTELEDHIILLCAIASHYLCPNYRKQCVEQTVVRDVLHRIVPYANDKTSRSVQRRTRYILKHPNTSHSFIMCLEEIKHCEFVEEKFGKPIIKKYENSIIPIEILRIAFVELVGFLNRKFSKHNYLQKGEKFIIPDTIQVLRGKYNCVRQNNTDVLVIVNQSKFCDVENIDDIEKDTVRSVIHSSLCSSKDKTSWAFQLFKIYQQYPENLLRSVISKIRTDQLASMKKTAMLKIRSSTSSILQSPLKLSMRYQILLQNSQFRYQGLMEANTFIQNFVSWISQIDTSDASYDITCSDHGTSLILENFIQNLDSDLIFEHPDQVIILDPILKVDTTFERILNKYHDILKAQTDIVLEEIKPLSDSDEENVPHFNPESQIGNNSEIKYPSRIGFHMMRAAMLERSDKNCVQHMHDYFVVQASKVFLKPNNVEKVLKWDENFKKGTSDLISEIRSKIIVPDYLQSFSLIDEIKSHFTNIDLVVEDFEFVEKVKCMIYNSGELGITLAELKNVVPDSKKVNLTYKNALEVLEKFHIILRVGVTCLRFVHYDFKKPWITHADKILRLEKEKLSKNLLPTKWKGKHILKSEHEHKNTTKDHRKIKILVAPWVRLDGSLNRRVLDRWLGKLVSTFVETPGIKLQDLILKINLLKSVETIFLVELLVKIGCIRLLKLHKPKITLFSDIDDYVLENTDILEDPNEVLIEPTTDAFFNFAAFVGNKNYNCNFID